MIKGKFVGLRAVERDDLQLLKEWRNISAFRKNFREVRELSLLDQENWFESLNRSKANNFMFTIVRLEDNKPIGAGGLLYINWIIRSADFSFYIGENDIYVDPNDNFSTEAADLLLNYGFNVLNLHKIWMELYEFDIDKIDFFLNKFNFHKDGFLRDNCFEGGAYFGSFIISLLEKEYVKQN